MFSIISNIVDYFYITNPIEDNIESTEDLSNVSDHEVVCKILEKEFCPNLSRSIEEIKEALFLKVFHEKISTQNVARILKIVGSLPDNKTKDLFYRDICELYLEKKNFDQALFSTTFIKDEYMASKLLETLSLDLFGEGRFDEALKIANSIHFDTTKAFVLRKMCIELASQNPSSCFRIIDCFPESEQWCKDATLSELMFSFVELGEKAKTEEGKRVCNQLALQFGNMIEYRHRFRIKV